MTVTPESEGNRKTRRRKKQHISLVSISIAKIPSRNFKQGADIVRRQMQGNRN